MNNSIHHFYFRYKIFEIEFLTIQTIVKYLNREAKVHELPDYIRNREDAYKAVMDWNERVEKLIYECVEYEKKHLKLIPLSFSKFLVEIK